MIALRLLTFAVTLLHRVPPSLTQRFGYALAGPVLAVWPQGREALGANLRILRPTATIQQRAILARLTVANYLRVLWDFTDLWLRPEAPGPRLTVSGWHQLGAAAQEGGALLATAHFGAWDVGARWLIRQGVPLTAVVDPFTSVLVQRVVQQTRATAGIQMITLTPSAHRGLFRQIEQALRERHVVGLLVDRPLVYGGVPVALCGQPTRWPAGLAYLARTHQVPLYVGWLRTSADGVGVGGLTHLSPGMGQSLASPEWPAAREGEAAVMQLVADELGPLFQSYPTQWYMFRRVWNLPSTARST